MHLPMHQAPRCLARTRLGSACQAQLGLGPRPLDHAGEASVLNGAPRSEVKTKGDLGFCSR